MKLIFKQILFLFILSQTPAFSQGNLMIVGGALSPDNKSIYETFIRDAGQSGKTKIGIIPAASGSPVRNATSFKQNLMAYGVDSSEIIILPLAVKDDKSTPEDESLWKNNANNKTVCSMIDECTALWFTGGDQTRITELLIIDGKKTSLCLHHIRKKWLAGMHIGGTSAGAAMMSDPMIAGGNSYGALRFGISQEYDDRNQQENGALVVKDGLSFINFCIIDQHFDRKARLGRLIVALNETKISDDKEEVINHGFGIDENTALYYTSHGRYKILGEGNVTIVNIKKMTTSRKQNLTEYKNVDISLLSEGDSFAHLGDSIHISSSKTTTKGAEYFSIKNPVASGVLSPNNTYNKFIFYNLVDNSEANEAVSYLFENEESGFKLLFRKGEDTEGFYGTSNNSYSAKHVKLDIVPVKITIKEF